jgi:hypothetical protein
MKKFYEFINENNSTPPFKLYRLNNPDMYNYEVITKDGDSYFMYIKKGEKMKWKYQGKIDPKIYTINGRLVKNPSMATIFIIQKKLKNND